MIIYKFYIKDNIMINTPYYLIDNDKLIKNLQILKDVEDRSGAKILLAQKAYSAFNTYPTIDKYLAGTTASGLYELKLASEYFNGETHIFSPAYTDQEIEEICLLASHMLFNSFNQWQKYKDIALKNGVSCGLRVNPEVSVGDTEIYDPCAKFSRLGITKQNFREDLLEGIEGLHFHALCEQNLQPLKEVLQGFIENFSKYFKNLKWVNFGGGHHITREDYDREGLIELIREFKQKYNLEVYLEPGEAVALNAGYLVTSVVDIIHNGMDIAILDSSAACHMPDVLEMPYRPNIVGASLPNEKEFTYRLGGPTCLAGDIIGDYSFSKPLEIGDTLVFLDMAIYSMVKNNTFNGMKLPSIALKEGDNIKLIKEFGYEDFKSRLS